MFPQVIVKSGKARPFYGRHPWVLASAVERVSGSPADGDAVDVCSHQGRFIARGIYNSRSRIRARLYAWDAAEQLDEAFWRRRIQSAIALRRQLGLDEPQGAVRLVFSEGDGLSGLIVDRYGDYLVVQPTALAIAVRLQTIADILEELTHPKAILLRTDRSTIKAEGLELTDGPYLGEAPAGPVTIEEHGLKFRVDLAAGQKTGFYLDQRDNRRAAALCCRGRRVLDMFCYTGGFSLAAAKAGAVEVLGVDASQHAVALAAENAALNGLKQASFRCGDCFRTMQELIDAGERFGAVILDPPRFARSRRNVPEALRAYHWLNRLACELLEPEGMLVTCSCSGHVGREQFLEMLLGVAQQTGRDIQILQQRGAAADHPVSITCRETEYLKCMICRVR
jgi:23S rRNA (cytosine1962-C5)-methyltransferase